MKIRFWWKLVFSEYIGFKMTRLVFMRLQESIRYSWHFFISANHCHFARNFTFMVFFSIQLESKLLDFVKISFEVRKRLNESLVWFKSINTPASYSATAQIYVNNLMKILLVFGRYWKINHFIARPSIDR